MLDYDAARATGDVRAAVLAFYRSAYLAGARRAGWDIEALTYRAPLSRCDRLRATDVGYGVTGSTLHAIKRMTPGCPGPREKIDDLLPHLHGHLLA